MTEQENRLNADTLSGIEALMLATEISKVKGLTFHIAFYPYSRSKGTASSKMKVKKNCKVRAQLPQGRFDIDSDNFFLFVDENGKEQTAYRYLIRYMGFPQDNYKMHKINWL